MNPPHHHAEPTQSFSMWDGSAIKACTTPMRGTICWRSRWRRKSKPRCLRRRRPESEPADTQDRKARHHEPIPFHHASFAPAPHHRKFHSPRKPISEPTARASLLASRKMIAFKNCHPHGWTAAQTSCSFQSPRNGRGASIKRAPSSSGNVSACGSHFSLRPCWIEIRER